jgi:TusA-related sulfurtransferase
MIAAPINPLDLRGTPCPLNYVRCRLALEELSSGDSLHVFLDQGEPKEMVVSGLLGEGHYVEVLYEDSVWIKLMVVCGDS